MRRGDQARSSEQRARFVRLLDEHVEGGPGDMTAVEGFLERSLVDEAAAGAIDDPHAPFGLGEILARQDVAGLIGERRVKGDEIGPGEKLVEIDLRSEEHTSELQSQSNLVCRLLLEKK